MIEQQPILSDAPSQPQVFSQQPSKRANKILFTTIFIIAGVLIIGGGVFAYFNYFQSPEKILQKMLINLANVNTFEYSGELKAEANTNNLLNGEKFLQSVQQAQNKKTKDFLIDFAGKSDIQSLTNPKGQFFFNIKTNALPSGEFIFGLDVMVIDKIMYIKINNVPNLGIFDLSFVKNQWVKIDAEAIKKQFGAAEAQVQFNEPQSGQELSPEQIKKLKLAFQKSQIIKITDNLPSEEIEGVSTYHYKFLIDKEEIKKFLIDSAQIIQNKTLTEKELADLDKTFGAIELPEDEVWIGKNDILPHKLILNYAAKDINNAETIGKFTITLLFKNFNKPVQIDIPAPVKTIEEILSGLFSGLKDVHFNGTLQPTN